LLQLDVVPALLDEHVLPTRGESGKLDLQLLVQLLLVRDRPIRGIGRWVTPDARGQYHQWQWLQRRGALGLSHLLPTSLFIDPLEVVEL
jgi:hypothetical protein